MKKIFKEGDLVKIHKSILELADFSITSAFLEEVKNERIFVIKNIHSDLNDPSAGTMTVVPFDKKLTRSGGKQWLIGESHVPFIIEATAKEESGQFLLNFGV